MLAEASRVPSGLNATLQTSAPCALMGRFWLVVVSQMIKVPSPLTETRRACMGSCGTGPGGRGEVTAVGAVRHAVDEAGMVFVREGHPARRVPDDHLPILAARGKVLSIGAVGEGRDRTPVARVRVIFRKVLTSQILTPPSFPAAARYSPSGRNARAETSPPWSSGRAWLMRPVAVSQSLTTPFLSPEARVSPPGLNATQRTAASWPRSRVRARPVATSQSLMVLSCPAEARILPAGWKATPLTGPVWPDKDARLGNVGQVPELDGQVMAGGGEPGAVRAEGHVVDRATVAPEGAELLAALPVPELDARVGAGRGEPLAVRAEGHAPDHTVVAFEDTRTGWPVVDLPDPHSPIEGGGGEVLPVRAERHTDRPVSRMTPQGEDDPAGRRVPEVDLAVRTGGGEPLPVGTEHHFSDSERGARMPPGPLGQLSGREIPDPHRPVRAGRGDPFAVRAVRDVPEHELDRSRSGEPPLRSSRPRSARCRPIRSRRVGSRPSG